MSPDRAKDFRYFTLTHLHNNSDVSEDDLQTYREALAKMVNSLSWRRSIVKPTPVDPDGTILRVNIKRLGWTVEQWNSLAASSPYAKFYDTVVSSAVASAIEVDRPYIRADWFVAKVSKPPLYHLFADIPETAEELERRLLDGKTADEALAENPYDIVRAGFSQGNSGVSQNNRMIERHYTGFGAYWRSFDFAAVDPNDPETAHTRNFFNAPTGPVGEDGFTFIHDGGEMIFNLPNGLQAYMLVDGQGNRIDIGPIEIVQDDTSFALTQSRQIINGISCIACHAGGLRDSRLGTINAERDELLDHVLAVGFPIKVRDSVEILHRPGDLKGLVAQDIERYLSGLERAGVPRSKATVTAEPISILVGRFNNTNVDLKAAAAELGFTLEDFEAALKARVDGSPELRSLRTRLQQGGVPREQFIAEFGKLRDALNIKNSKIATQLEIVRETVVENKNALLSANSEIRELKKTVSLARMHPECGFEL